MVIDIIALKAYDVNRFYKNIDELIIIFVLNFLKKSCFNAFCLAIALLVISIFYILL